jgi:hypothetical protein
MAATLRSNGAQFDGGGLSVEEQRARWISDHRAAIDRHTREENDPQWSSRAEKSLESLLRPLAANGNFQVESVDCRTTSCMAALVFDTYADARKTWPTILHARNHVGCITDIMLEDPDGGAKYGVTVFYDCSEGRRAQLSPG